MQSTPNQTRLRVLLAAAALTAAVLWALAWTGFSVAAPPLSPTAQSARQMTRLGQAFSVTAEPGVEQQAHQPQGTVPQTPRHLHSDLTVGSAVKCVPQKTSPAQPPSALLRSPSQIQFAQFESLGEPAVDGTSGEEGTVIVEPPQPPPSVLDARATVVETDPVPPGEGDRQFVFNAQETDIRELLDMLSRQGGLNILASPNVQGKISVCLTDTDVHTALSAILRVSGYVARHEGNFIYVGTRKDFETMAQDGDCIGTRVYRPNYATASELESLITPLLSQGVGVVSVSSAAQVGIGPDTAAAGGNEFAGGDVVLVRDYEAVLCQVDQVVQEVDRQPLQVVIEAMIVAVKLDDSLKMGMDWEFFRNNDNVRLVLGTPPASLGAIDVVSGGLQFGFLDGSLGVFLQALETVGDVNVIAAPRLLCLNKQRAEIHIGREVGYISTTITENAATETVEFLEVGTQLRMRPYVSEDGMIRLEIHPELSTGDVEVRQGFTIPDKDVTQVTTNVMVRDGATVVIGGLIREDLKKTSTQVPFFGSLPLAGIAFRKKTEEIDREEVVVLITPRIVYEPRLNGEGEQMLSEYYHRQSIYRDKMSPISKRFYGRHYFRLAAAAWAQGEANKALRYVNLSIQHDPMSRQAATLRSEIVTNSPYGDVNTHTHLRKGLAPWSHPVGGLHLPFWVYDELGALPQMGCPCPRPFEPGTPGAIRQLETPPGPGYAN